MPTRLRTPARTAMVAICPMTLLVVFYCSAGIGGFLRFGAQTQGDALLNFAPDDPVAGVARVAVAVSAMSAYPMQHFPARSVLHRLWALCLAAASGSGSSSAEPSPCFILVEGIFYVALTLLLAILIGSDLALIFQLLGSLVIGGVVLVVPGALLYFASPPEVLGAPPKCDLVPAAVARALLSFAFVALGVFMMISGTVVTITQRF